MRKAVAGGSRHDDASGLFQLGIETFCLLPDYLANALVRFEMVHNRRFQFFALYRA
jgi:hypothetical protein